MRDAVSAIAEGSAIAAGEGSLACGDCAADNAGSPNAKANADAAARHLAPPRAFSERREAIIRAESSFAWTKAGRRRGRRARRPDASPQDPEHYMWVPHPSEI